MIQIINTWESEKGKLKYYELEERTLIEKNGDYAAYSQWNGSVIYTYKNIAINNLTNFNKEHFDRIVKNERPKGDYTPSHFLFDRAIQNKNVGLGLL
jgi:hypothetical protein